MLKLDSKKMAQELLKKEKILQENDKKTKDTYILLQEEDEMGDLL